MSQLEDVVVTLRSGGVIAYPTEAVFGLGCDPRNADAVGRIFKLKRRHEKQGFLVIAASVDQLNDYVDWSALNQSQIEMIHSSWPGPRTWVIPKSVQAPRFITGDHAGIAVRVTAHEVSAELCRAFGGALVSTSANVHGLKPAKSVESVFDQFSHSDLDGILDAELGGSGMPSEIRDATTGMTLRAG